MAAIVEAELTADFLCDCLADNRQRQEDLQLERRNLGVHAGLELDPETWHRNKNGRTRALQVTLEGFQRFDE